MLLSWYDRDRDFESPQHASECHLDSAVPGYVDYGIYHGATLKVDIEQGRFVFFVICPLKCRNNPDSLPFVCATPCEECAASKTTKHSGLSRPFFATL